MTKDEIAGLIRPLRAVAIDRLSRALGISPEELLRNREFMRQLEWYGSGCVQEAIGEDPHERPTQPDLELTGWGEDEPTRTTRPAKVSSIRARIKR